MDPDKIRAIASQCLREAQEGADGMFSRAMLSVDGYLSMLRDEGTIVPEEIEDAICKAIIVTRGYENDFSHMIDFFIENRRFPDPSDTDLCETYIATERVSGPGIDPQGRRYDTLKSVVRLCPAESEPGLPLHWLTAHEWRNAGRFSDPYYFPSHIYLRMKKGDLIEIFPQPEVRRLLATLDESANYILSSRWTWKTGG